MIICGTEVRVKDGRPKVSPEYYGEKGVVFKRTRFLKALGAGEYEIRFYEDSLNRINGVTGGFIEEDLEIL